jgi:hypothetical protein
MHVVPPQQLIMLHAAPRTDPILTQQPHPTRNNYQRPVPTGRPAGPVYASVIVLGRRMHVPMQQAARPGVHTPHACVLARCVATGAPDVCSCKPSASHHVTYEFCMVV